MIRAVALEYLVGAQRIFNGNQRYVGLLYASYEEYERFLTYKFLVVAHSADTVTECITLGYQLGRALCDKGNIYVVLRSL